MIKIRIQGTTKDLKWFVKLLKKDKHFELNDISEPMCIKGSKKFKKVYADIFRNKDDLQNYKDSHEPRLIRHYCGTGLTYEYVNPQNKSY